MDNITIGQVVAAIGTLTILGAFFVAIYKWYKNHITDKFQALEQRLDVLETATKMQDKDIQDSKEERLVIVNGLLACLKGLHNDLNCNGPVTQGINDIENYLIKKGHE